MIRLECVESLVKFSFFFFVKKVFLLFFIEILANPVYDKLTISRAAQIRKQNSTILLKRSRPRTFNTPLKSLSHDQTFIKVNRNCQVNVTENEMNFYLFNDL